jgi:hypothetical protein
MTINRNYFLLNNIDKPKEENLSLNYDLRTKYTLYEIPHFVRNDNSMYSRRGQRYPCAERTDIFAPPVKNIIVIPNGVQRNEESHDFE